MMTGKDVTDWRKAQGMTQTELAEMLSTSLRTVQRHEASALVPVAFAKQIIDLKIKIGLNKIKSIIEDINQ